MPDPTQHDRPAGNHNNRLWKWVSGVLSVLLAAVVVGYVDNIRQVEHIRTTMDLMSITVKNLEVARVEAIKAREHLGTAQGEMGKAVVVNTQWRDDWYNKLRVPERDQRQDSAIEDIIRRLVILEGT